MPAFTDPDGNTLTYTATLADGGSLPAWLRFNPTTRTLSGTPLEPDTPTTLTIRVTATDDGEPPASAITDFALAVSERNDAPIAADDTATVDEGGSIDITASTLLANNSDAEGDAVSIPASTLLSNDSDPDDDPLSVIGLDASVPAVLRRCTRSARVAGRWSVLMAGWTTGVGWWCGTIGIPTSTSHS